MSRICPDILGKLRHEIDICCVIFFLFWEGGPLVALLVICLVCVYKFFSSITPSMVTSPTFHLQVPTSVCSYRLSQKKIGFRNVAKFSLWGLSAVKIRVFWGAEYIYTLTRCLAHVPDLSSLLRTPIYLLTYLWMAIWSKVCHFLKPIFFGTPCS